WSSDVCSSDLRHAETGKARFLEAGSNQPLWQSNSLAAATPEQVSRAFLSIYGPLFGLRGQERELALMQQKGLGSHSFVRFQQMYQGIPVLAGEIVLQTNQQSAVVSANGEALPDLQVASQPIRELVLVDALRGNIALHFNQIVDAKQRIVCDDKNAVDPDGNQDNNCIPAAYARVEGQGPTGSSDVDFAYDYAGVTYDYY